MDVRIANREDPDQTASSVRSGCALFGRQPMFESLEHLPFSL